jgi:adenine-specific DNA-methyltransferase
MSEERLNRLIEDFSQRNLNLFLRSKCENYAETPQDLPEHDEEGKFAGFEKVGEIRFDDGDRLVVTTARVKGDLSERTGKRSQYDKAKKILRELAVYDAGLFIFCDDAADFRFSLVYAHFQGTTRTFSNFRRFTYFVSKAQTNKTFRTRVGGCAFSTLEAVKDAFSVEKVNKEFYGHIAKFFYRLTGYNCPREMKLPSVPDEDKKRYQEFAVRLIGRAIFCWFLKHKKSANGVSLIPESILSSRAVRQNSQYYHSTLEKLFFEVLNTPEGQRQVNLGPDADSVPFLNGGLFEPHDDFYDNGESLYGLVIPDIWFEHFFEILEQYNFTIDENSTVDADVSVDPEMLGRIFENLLAEVDPQTGETARKATGSYYTPRPIVDYMVDQSFRQYLLAKTKIDESTITALLSYEPLEIILSEGEKSSIASAIDEMKIIDPACGSGAFPMGILHKMLLVLQKVDPDLRLWLRSHLDSIEQGLFKDRLLERIRNENWQYVRKLLIIQKSIYGVDIQTIAVEISKLRFFLSLIVDEKIEDTKDNRGVEPLPNLEFKFVAANSLIGLPSVFGRQMDLGFGVADKISRLKELRNRYLRIYGKQKEEIETDFLKTRAELIELNISMHGRDTFALHLASWNPFENETCEWFDPEWMFGVEDGFDVVIANPPYGVTIKGQQRASTLRSLGKVPDYEIFYFFIQLAHGLLKPYGQTAYIIPNTILFNVFAREYRLNLLKNWDVKLIVDCTNFKFFEAATVHNVIAFLQKNEGCGDVGYKNTSKAFNFHDLISRPTLSVGHEQLVRNNMNWGLVFKLDQQTLLLTQKIRYAKRPLKSCFPDVSQGLIAYDKYRGQTHETIQNRIYHYREKAKNSLKPWLWGEDVKRYVVTWNQREYIDYCDGIANPREPKLFKGQRILIREITNPSIYAAFTDEELYHDPAIIVVKEGKDFNLLCLLAVLNSRLASFYHFNSSPKATKGSFPKILVKDVQEFPLPDINTEQTATLENLVNKIIPVLKDKSYSLDIEKQSIIAECEHQIDQMVYALYGLTSEEIALVEGKSSE